MGPSSSRTDDGALGNCYDVIFAIDRSWFLSLTIHCIDRLSNTCRIL